MEEKMSINALANAAAARRPDFFPLGRVPEGMQEIAKAAATSPDDEPQAYGGSAASGTSTQIDTTLNLLFGHIAPQRLEFYVGVVVGVQQAHQLTFRPCIAFWIFV